MVAYNDRLTLLEHLDELRKRLIHAAIGIAIAVLIAALLNRYVFHLLLAPLNRIHNPDVPHKITTFSPAEPFMVSLKVWVYVGLIIAAPVIIYEFWAFVGPAFAPTSRRAVVLVVGVCAMLFLSGVALAYFVILPKGLEWLFSFNGKYFNTQARASDYFTFVAWFLVAFGAVFELPVIIVSAVRIGVVSTKTLRKHWRYAILINAIIAMLATPSQDLFSFFGMFIPLEILYELSLLVARVVERRRDAVQAVENPDDEGPGDGGLSSVPAS